MYTILIKNDNTAVATERQRIMQRSKLVDVFRVLVPKTYLDQDMAQFDLVLQYRTPVTHTLRIVKMQKADSDYDAEHLMYLLPFDTDMTKENGNLEITFSFLMSQMDENGKVTQHVREIDPTIIPIIELAQWLTPQDEAMSDMAQLYLANQQLLKELEELAKHLYEEKADDIAIDPDTGIVHLVSHKNKIGQGVTSEELGNEIAERTTEGLVKVNE